MSDAGTPHFRYADLDTELCVAFEGSATHRASLAADAVVAQFLNRVLDHPRVVLDLADCAWIDSTFAGWLIKIRQRLGTANGALVLSRCPSTCWKSLDVMGLTALFEFHDVTLPVQMQPVLCDSEQADAHTIEFMLAAHEDLARAGHKNQQAFARIAGELQRELDARNKGS